jgi:hypothetical protein
MFEFMVWVVAIAVSFVLGWKLGGYIEPKLAEWWAKLTSPKVDTPPKDGP